jgi:hypothetical protein
MKKYKVAIPHYEWFFTLITGDTIDGIIEYAEDKWGFEVGNSLGFTAVSPQIVLCGIPPDADETTIWHEATHLTYQMLRDKGIGFEEEETFAYTQGFIVRQIKKKLNANK